MQEHAKSTAGIASAILAAGFCSILALTSNAQTSTRASLSWLEQSDGGSPPADSAYDRRVAFESKSDDLTNGACGHCDSAYVVGRVGCTATVATYCTVSPTSIPVCAVAVTARGAPSLAASAALVASSGLVPGKTSELANHGLIGSIEQPCGHPGSCLCAALPRRTSVGESGGTARACGGQFTFTLQELVAVEPEPVPGRHVAIASWFRAAPTPATIGLSNAIWLILSP